MHFLASVQGLTFLLQNHICMMKSLYLMLRLIMVLNICLFFVCFLFCFVFLGFFWFFFRNTTLSRWFALLVLRQGFVLEL